MIKLTSIGGVPHAKCRIIPREVESNLERQLANATALGFSKADYR